MIVFTRVKGVDRRRASSVLYAVLCASTITHDGEIDVWLGDRWAHV